MQEYVSGHRKSPKALLNFKTSYIPAKSKEFLTLQWDTLKFSNCLHCWHIFCEKRYTHYLVYTINLSHVNSQTSQISCAYMSTEFLSFRPTTNSVQTGSKGHELIALPPPFPCSTPSPARPLPNAESM